MEKFPVNFTADEVYALLKSVIPDGVPSLELIKGLLMMVGDVMAVTGMTDEIPRTSVKGLLDCYVMIAKENIENNKLL